MIQLQKVCFSFCSTSKQMALFSLTGFLAIKYMCSLKSEWGIMMPLFWDTLNSSPRISRPLSLQAAGKRVLLRRHKLWVSFLQTKYEKFMKRIFSPVIHLNNYNNEQKISICWSECSTVDLYGGVLSNWSSLRSSSSSGLTPIQERRKTTGSGFPMMQHTKLSSTCLGVFGYAHTISSCQDDIKHQWQGSLSKCLFWC